MKSYERLTGCLAILLMSGFVCIAILAVWFVIVSISVLLSLP